MRLLSKICSLFRRWKPDAPTAAKDIPSQLSHETLEQVMREARFLHARGASARELEAGESPDGSQGER